MTADAIRKQSGRSTQAEGKQEQRPRGGPVLKVPWGGRPVRPQGTESEAGETQDGARETGGNRAGQVLWTR